MISIKNTIPVLSSINIASDVKWYVEQLKFKCAFQNEGYAILKLNSCELHLQWHANTDEDPHIKGAVVRFLVDGLDAYNILLEDLGTVDKDKIQRNTAWGTNEVEVFDPNMNALIFVERINPT